MLAMANTESSGDTARPWQCYNTAYTNAKAGMEGVDKEKVQRIVYEMSKGSQYFKNEERKEAFFREKIENMRARCAKLKPADLAHYQTVADKIILELEATRDLSRIWVHVDMDAFYAAVETLSDPSLKGKPMAVGGMSMISTANYEARRFGVRAAMPGFIARKLCPELIFVPTDFKKYTYYSDLTRKVFEKYDPDFVAASLDEAYLDVTEVCKERGTTGEEIARELRAGVHDETGGLTCSAGVAPNRLLAKVCSDINKPNGQFILPNDRMAVMTFISSLPVRKIGGIGKVTEHILRDALGISTCEEILQKSSYICALFSHSSADFFLSVGLAIGGTDTPQVRSRRSISNERTFSATGDEAFLFCKLADIAEMLSTDLQKEGLRGRTLTLKLKTASFEVRTRAVTSQKNICSTEDIMKHASKLLKAELPVSLRLIEKEEIYESTSNANAEKMNANDSQNEDNVQDVVPPLLGPGYSFPAQFEGSSLDRVSSVTKTLGYVASSSVSQKEFLLWVNDYKCSICGIEMPPSFVEERQEHFDFHLAEKLQKEESGTDFKTCVLKKRNVPKDHIASQRKHKKQKPSPKEGKHIPIDVFFVKSNQNF
ncbi:hypothetical protein GBA52_027542 [Prunus armeniaca]|nr:hypothetical protein GBA52_027542 [Prunus armeniaca]